MPTIVLLSLCICINQLKAQQEQKTKLAIIRITYNGFAEIDRKTIDSTLYKNLSQDERLVVITEAQTQKNLAALAIDPDRLTDKNGYIKAGQALGADYILTGSIQRFGSFLDGVYQVITIADSTQKKYPAGKTFDIYVDQEIPQLVTSILKGIIIRSPIVIHPDRNSSRHWYALGGATAVVVAYFLLKPEDESRPVLPLPPGAP